MTIEQYAKENKKLHPDVWGLLIDFDPQYAAIRNTMRIEIKKASWGLFQLSGRGNSMPVFVIGRTVYIIEGCLNQAGYLWKDTLNIGIPGGFADLAHQCWHVIQHHRKGSWWIFRQYIKGIFRSWITKRKLWAHSEISMEREAVNQGAKAHHWYIDKGIIFETDK